MAFAVKPLVEIELTLNTTAAEANVPPAVFVIVTLGAVPKEELNVMFVVAIVH